MKGILAILMAGIMMAAMIAPAMAVPAITSASVGNAAPAIDSIEITDGIVRIHFDGKRNTSSQILSKLVSLGFEIVSYNLERMGLEDFYVSIMGDEKGLK